MAQWERVHLAVRETQETQVQYLGQEPAALPAQEIFSLLAGMDLDSIIWALCSLWKLPRNSRPYSPPWTAFLALQSDMIE